MIKFLLFILPLNCFAIESIYSTKLWDAIAHVESGCGKYLVGDDGRSLGMYQVQLTTARQYGFTGTKKQLKNPTVNFVYAFAYLSDMYRKNDGNLYSALRSYNAGLGHTKRGKSYRNNVYVRKVLKAISEGRRC